MPVSKPLVATAVAALVGASAAMAIESFYRISFTPRPPIVDQDSAQLHDRSAFPLRMVDSGGVGIPFEDRWGQDYSHDRRTFRGAITLDPPFVDDAAFTQIEADWQSYVDRMREYGNNAIAVPLFAELIDFDGHGVYDGASPFLGRHAAIRQHVRPLFDWTVNHGMQVFLDTDMLAVTPPLYKVLRQIAPGRGPTSIDASDPRVWELYRAGFEELFEHLPAVSGIVIRFGEGGALYSTEGWPYRSEVAIRDAASLRAMLRGLLPLFEAKHKTLVLRSWTVGVGKLGRLHIDPTVYEAVLSDINSSALIVSTKVTGGDFFSYLALNPTLLRGPHRRLIELQAKPEFEGFGALPDFLGEEYARALNQLRAANPHIAGTFLFSQFGGPLRAGPRTLYPLHGFWLWTDANVFLASQLAIDPDANVRELLNRWASLNFTAAPIADAIADSLLLTRSAMLDGFYIRPFAEHQIQIGPLELPPLMWIFEWKMVGGWNSLLSLVYRGSRDAVPAAIQQGHDAADKIRQAHRRLQAVVNAAGPDACSHICHDALRSFEYQESLINVLAWWRQTFLSYYRWIDTGDRASWNAWRAGRREFENAANAHLERFGDDDRFPAFDLTSAQQAVAATTHATRSRWTAATMLGGLVLFVVGAGRGRVESTRPAVLLTIALAVSIAVVAGLLTDFASVWLAAGVATVIAAVAVAFAMTTGRSDHGRGRGRFLIAAAAPLIPITIFLLAALAYGGPIGVWYWFWMSRSFRLMFFTVTIATVVWAIYSMYSAPADAPVSARLGGILAAGGVGIVSFFGLAPSWLDVLRLLNRPLNIAPATETMLFALRTYAGVNAHPRAQILIIGALFAICGYLLCRRSPWLPPSAFAKASANHRSVSEGG